MARRKEEPYTCFNCPRDRSNDDVSGDGRDCPDCGWNDEYLGPDAQLFAPRAEDALLDA